MAETVIATLSGVTSGDTDIQINGSANSATATITDNDTANATLSVTTQGDEAGPVSIVFTVTLDKVNNTGSAITFDLADLATGSAVSGSDYTAIAPGAQISVADGAATGTYSVVVADDALLEATETLNAQISNSSNLAVSIAGANATANITDNDTATVTLSANDAAAAEAGSDPGQFTVDLGKVNNTGAPITVTYSVGGSATAGADYTALTGSVQILAGQQTAVINVAGIVDDLLLEAAETVTVTLTGTSNAAVGVDATPASVTIADNDTATVTLSANDAAAAEAGSDPGQFTVDLGKVNNTGAPITVTYSVAAAPPPEPTTPPSPARCRFLPASRPP